MKTMLYTNPLNGKQFPVTALELGPHGTVRVQFWQEMDFRPVGNCNSSQSWVFAHELSIGDVS